MNWETLDVPSWDGAETLTTSNKNTTAKKNTALKESSKNEPTKNTVAPNNNKRERSIQEKDTEDAHLNKKAKQSSDVNKKNKKQKAHKSPEKPQAKAQEKTKIKQKVQPASQINNKTQRDADNKPKNKGKEDKLKKQQPIPQQTKPDTQKRVKEQLVINNNSGGNKKEQKVKNEGVTPNKGNTPKTETPKSTPSKPSKTENTPKNVKTNKSQQSSNSPKSKIELMKEALKQKIASKSLSINTDLSPMQQKMKEKLQSGQFRWINEQLYTTKGENSFDLFQKDPTLFDVYHNGFQLQVEKWPQNPVDLYIDYIKSCPSNVVVADFGCGEARLAQSVKNKVHSFDLVARNKFITACDISNVPLEDQSVDIAIFSLSLMGTNYLEFLKEAHRVLKPERELKIAEVKSRFEQGVDKFIKALRNVGFDLVSQDDSNTMFILFDLKKSSRKPKNADYELKPCRYKKR